MLSERATEVAIDSVARIKTWLILEPNQKTTVCPFRNDCIVCRELFDSETENRLLPQYCPCHIYTPEYILDKAEKLLEFIKINKLSKRY